MALVAIGLSVLLLVVAFLTTSPNLAVLGLAPAVAGGLTARAFNVSRQTKALTKVYGSMPSAGRPIEVDLFDDRLTYATPSARNEWMWSHWTEFWSSDEALLLVVGDGAGVLFIPADAVPADQWPGVRDLARSRVPPLRL